MTFVRWKMEHTPVRNGEAIEEDTTTYYDIIDPTVRWKLGDSKDAFECKLRNIDGELNGKINPMDRLTIYRTVNSETFTASDIIFVALVVSANQEQSASDSVIKIVSYSFSDEVMTSVIFVAGNNRPINEVLDEATRTLQTRPGTLNIVWDPDNPSLKSDNVTPFPPMLEDWKNRPFRDLLIKYSTDQFTQDGSYTWYVSRDNKLVWKRSESFQLQSFNVTTTPIYSFRTDLDREGIRNYVIVKCGLDPAGVQIQRAVHDMPSIARYGQKFQVLIAEAGNAQIFNRMDLIKSYGQEVRDTTYPDLSAGFTTAWRSAVTKEIDVGVNMVEGEFVTIPDSGTDQQRRNRYTAIIREQALAIGIAEANRFMKARRFGKLGFEFDVEPGTLGWSLGERVNDIIPWVRLNQQINLRVQEIQYGEDSDKYVIAEEIGSL